MFGNPAKLDLLPPNSRGFATSAHAKCAIYRLGSKRSGSPGLSGNVGRGSKPSTPACEHIGSPPRYRDYMRVQTLSTGIFDCLTTQLVRDRTKFGEKVELEVAVFGRDGLRFLELEVLPESKK